MRSVVSRISQSVRMARFSTDVKAICGSSPFAQQFASRLRRLHASLLAQIDVMPAGEQILDIPNALSVSNQDEFSGHFSS